MSMLIGVAGLVLMILAAIGVVRGRAPLIKLKGRGPYVGLLVGGFIVTAIGGALMPESEVTITVTPANATVKVDGQTFTQSPVKLPLNDLTYTVEASAAGYHSESVKFDAEEQKAVTINLKQITAEEIAAQKAAEAQKARDAAAAPAVAQAKADRAAKELDDGTMLVKCENLVRSRLKSPSTAKFPGTMEAAAAITTYENGNKDWSGWVDSQNSFGAMLRTEFLCEYDLESQQLEVTLRQ